MITLWDGATSTNIIHNETCIEKHLLIHPEDLENLHKEYKEAGSVALLAPTFLSNRYYLKEHGLEDRVCEINTFLVSLSKKSGLKVGGSIAPILDDIQNKEEIYMEQINALIDARCDFIMIETMANLNCAKTILKSLGKPQIPVYVTMVIGDSGLTSDGFTALECFNCLTKFQISGFGFNCTSPSTILENIKSIPKNASIPIIAKPSAGLPGRLIKEEKFAEYMELIIKEGATIIGGCCGTTPSYIKQLAKKVYHDQNENRNKEL